ncbi:peptide-methionine (S)-S-oxide reductase MsrA [Saprospiraceae bacterium]|nr:peptide-methionine (S)-S-oxide reductase MsrA [Saprospiraceae bacterium]
MNKTITLGGGCFWCTEAVYDMIEGVISVTSGYIDGHVDNPTYREVCTGTTGHNEVIQVVFNDEVISLRDIIDIFWTAHDPTTLNQQGADRGTQYRSGIYFQNDEDEAIILASKEAGQKLWSDPIVTEVKKATVFYPAEKYHHDYYERNSHAGYCRVVINPKLAKVRAAFAHKIKK